MQIHHPPLRLRWLGLALALGCLACSKGGSDLPPVQGKVLYKDQPAAGALVTFHPRGDAKPTTERPVGTVQKDGTFTLTTGPKDGAPPGEYTVTFIWPEEVAAKGKKQFSTSPPDSRDKLNGAYADPARSTFKVTINSGTNQLEPFRLK
jgi:hypothetical protein